MKKYIYNVYKHTFPNGKIYFGITSKKPEKRWGNVGNQYKKQSYMWNAIQKYGWNNIKHEIVAENLAKEEACQMEINLIAIFKTNQKEFGYNLQKGGTVVENNFCSEEKKKKLSDSWLNREHKKHTEEEKQKISLNNKGKNKGKTWSFKTRAKITKSRNENPNFGKWNKGRIITEEEKQKISNSLKGRLSPMKGKKMSKETCEKLSKQRKNHYGWNKGKHWSEETKRKCSISHKGQKAWNKGLKVSEDTKKKISQGVTNAWLTGKMPNIKRNPTFKKVNQIDKNTNQIIRTFNSIKEASIVTGCHSSKISSACRGYIKTSGGYVWKYAYE